MSRQVQLAFGSGKVASFEFDESCEIFSFEAAGVPIPDPAAAAYDAVSQPLGYPPLAAACVPGDRVVIAVEHDVPHPVAVVRGVLRALGEGAEVHTTVLCASSELADQLRAAFEEDVCVESHDPNDQEHLTYLAALKDGQPLYLDRLLHECDVVVPIGALRPAASFGYGGVGSCLYPAFSSAEAQADFRRLPVSLDEQEPPAPSWSASGDRFEQAAEAAWLLGAQFTLQVLAGKDGQVLSVLAGDCQEVQTQGVRACDSAWTFAPPSRSTLVIAGIDGDAGQQTWDNFARALDAAHRAAEDDADILLCTELAVPPGPALAELGGDWVDDELSRELHRSRAGDAGVATLLWNSLQNAHVHLHSKLPDEVVYSLGMTPVSGDNLTHVVGAHRQCSLIHSAHRAAVLQRQSDNVCG